MENRYEFMTLNDISDAQVTIHLNSGWHLHGINIIGIGIHGYFKEFYFIKSNLIDADIYEMENNDAIMYVADVYNNIK